MLHGVKLLLLRWNDSISLLLCIVVVVWPFLLMLFLLLIVLLVNSCWRNQSTSWSDLCLIVYTLLLIILIISHIESSLVNPASTRRIWGRWLITLDSDLSCIFLVVAWATNRVQSFLRTCISGNNLLLLLLLLLVSLLLLLMVIFLLLSVMLDCSMRLRIVHRRTILTGRVHIVRSIPIVWSLGFELVLGTRRSPTHQCCAVGSCTGVYFNGIRILVLWKTNSYKINGN